MPLGPPGLEHPAMFNMVARSNEDALRKTLERYGHVELLQDSQGRLPQGDPGRPLLQEVQLQMLKSPIDSRSVSSGLEPLTPSAVNLVGYLDSRRHRPS